MVQKKTQQSNPKPQEQKEKMTAVAEHKVQSKRGRKPVPENETKEQKFRRLAQRRVTIAVKAIKALGKLSTSQYERSESQCDKIELAIETELQKTMALLRNVKSKSAEPEFTL